jgi:hypothetical protein
VSEHGGEFIDSGHTEILDLAAELDNMSIRDWIAGYVPGGVSSKLGRFIDVAYTIEYGADIAKQPALNFIYLFGFAGPTSWTSSRGRLPVINGWKRGGR